MDELFRAKNPSIDVRDETNLEARKREPRPLGRGNLLKDTQINLIVKKFSIFLTVFIISFLFFDILLLRIIPQPCQLTEPDQTTKYRFIPNRSCRVSTSEFDVQYRINELGLRDYSVKKEKSEEEYRILFLGDSFTEGQGVQIEDTMVKKVEDLLNKQTFSANKNLPNRNFRAINAGVAGYSTLLEYLYLVNRGIELNPDLVVVNVNVTDFTEERANLKHALRDSKGKVIGVYIEKKWHLPQILDKLLKNYSFSYNIFLRNEENILKLKGRIFALIKGEKAPEYTKTNTDFNPGDLDRDLFAITRNIPTDEFDALFKPVEERILKMRDFLKEKDIPMILVFIPNGHQINTNEWQAGRIIMKLTDDVYPARLNEALKEFANQNEIPFLDPADGLKSYLKDHQPSLYYKYDGHLTPLGHQITSQLIFEFLTENELIK